MVISKGFSLITNTFLDENRLQGLNEIGMEKKREKRRNSLQGPCKDLRKYKECLTEPDDEEFAEEKKERIGYRFIKVDYSNVKSVYENVLFSNLRYKMHKFFYHLPICLLRMKACGYNSKYHTLGKSNAIL